MTYHVGDHITVENETHVLSGTIKRGTCPDTGETVRERGAEVDESGTFWLDCGDETLRVNGWLASDITKRAPWGVDIEDLRGTLLDCLELAQRGCPKALADYVASLSPSVGGVYVSHMIEGLAAEGTFAEAVFDILAA